MTHIVIKHNLKVVCIYIHIIIIIYIRTCVRTLAIMCLFLYYISVWYIYYYICKFNMFYITNIYIYIYIYIYTVQVAIIYIYIKWNPVCIYVYRSLLIQTRFIQGNSCPRIPLST